MQHPILQKLSERAMALLWPTRIILFALAGLLALRARYDAHTFFSASDAPSQLLVFETLATILALIGAAWVGLTQATRQRLDPPDLDRPRRAGLFGLLLDRLAIMGEPIASFVAAAAIVWFGSALVPEALHALSAKTPATLTMVMHGTYAFDGSPLCPTATGFAPGYGFETICLPDTLRDSVDGHYGTELTLSGTASPYGFTVQSVSPL